MPDALLNLEEIDSSQIFLLGYALGAKGGRGIEEDLCSAGSPDALKFEPPLDINRFAHCTQGSAFDWSHTNNTCLH